MPPIRMSDIVHAGRVLLRQFQRDIRLILTAIVAGLPFLVGAFFIDWASGETVSIEILLRDPLQSANLPFYMGFVSNVGILGWAAGASFCGLAWGVLRRTRNHPMVPFFALGGLLLAALGLDDFFIIHEEVVPVMLFPEDGWLHISEKGVFAFYGVFALVFLIRCRRVILNETPFGLLAAGMGFLAASLVVDVLGISSIVHDRGNRLLVEDGAKLLGILCWAGYFATTALRHLAPKDDRE